ncbi:piggyBac transposable element-derived protein 3-like isoform X1 [Anabrus simplex]|uniref:piggyBac transposable element-derived protein 3-like isoform X1 n=1 Tax=Anabrus simplex TaxID=316456 RepID=UPI0035A2E88B
MEEPAFVKCEPAWSSGTEEERSNFEQNAVPPSDNQIKVKEEPNDTVADPSFEGVDTDEVKGPCSDEDDVKEPHDEECDDSGGSSHDLENIVALKTGQVYSCDSCSKPFKTTSDLKRHFLTHTEFQTLENDEGKILELLEGNESEIEGLSDDDDDNSAGLRERTEVLWNSESDSEGDEPDAVPSPKLPAPTPNSRPLLWRRKPFTSKPTPSPFNYVETVDHTVKRPLEYFSEYFPDDFFETTAYYTNNYSLSKNGKELKTSASEIKKFFGVNIVMGNIPYPRMTMYWRDDVRLDIVASAIARDRFFDLRQCLHFMETDAVNSEEVSTNRLWKVQPIIDTVRKKCLAIPRESKSYSVDEQIIPFTGRCKLRQYVKNKPRPVGLNNFIITTSSGLVVDFEIYQGTTTPLPERQLGLGPSIVLRLIQTLPPGSYVYFDHFFTTVGLMDKLIELNLEGTGTIMVNRLKGVHFSHDSKLRQGDYEEFCRNDEKLVAVKWRDSKCVTLLSTCSGAEPVANVKRWSKKEGKYNEVPCPFVVRCYNPCMGGVDICDQQMECYRTWIKTKKWTLKVSLHFLDLALVNAWMEYQEDCRKAHIPAKDNLDLLGFRTAVSEALIAAPTKKRRHSTEDDCSSADASRTRVAKIPALDKRLDGYDHWPVVDELKSARCCRQKDCKSRTRTRCMKCNVYLCLNKDFNCFKLFHTMN